MFLWTEGVPLHVEECATMAGYDIIVNGMAFLGAFSERPLGASSSVRTGHWCSVSADDGCIWSAGSPHAALFACARNKCILVDSNEMT